MTKQALDSHIMRIKIAFIVALIFPLMVAAQPQPEPSSANFKSRVKKFVGPVPSQPFWNLQASIWTTHYSKNPEHNNNQDLLGLERHSKNSYLFGAATFRHSFGKRSSYIYSGKRFDFANTPFFSKVTIGLIHGYRGEYRDKIPFNRYKIAPAVIPSIGVKYKAFTAEAVMLGNSAAMVTLGLRFGN